MRLPGYARVGYQEEFVVWRSRPLSSCVSGNNRLSEMSSSTLAEICLSASKTTLTGILTVLKKCLGAATEPVDFRYCSHRKV